MARYKIRREAGVIDTENANAVILPVKSDPAWQEYLAWLKAGDSPDAADAMPPELPPAPSGRARQARLFNRLAATDQMAALVKEKQRDYKNRL
jgi:hypothetical protein